jgi:thioredoxin 1
MLQKIFPPLIAFFIILFLSQGSLQALNPKELPVKGMVNLIDLGADSCLPCKMMAPIMTKLEKNYKGKAAIIFIDVWKFPDQAKRFGIRAIPTQIFYDKEGKEVHRHEGFMSERDIVAQLKKMGVN